MATSRNTFIKKSERGYSLIEMIRIFFCAPFILAGRMRWLNDDSLFELRADGQHRKFRYRLFLLVLGSAFWIMVIFLFAKGEEKKSIEEIRQYGTMDSLKAVSTLPVSEN